MGVHLIGAINGINLLHFSKFDSELSLVSLFPLLSMQLVDHVFFIIYFLFYIGV